MAPSPRTRAAAVAAVAGGALLVAGAGVYAALQATAFNTTPQPVKSGTLKLTLGDNGAGFSTAVSDLAPGDVVKRHVTLANGGSLKGVGLTLKATGSGTKLSTDATNGLQVTVTECSVAWVPSTGTCAGLATPVLTSSLAGLATAKPLTGGDMNPASSKHLQVTVTLPDQNETTVNGVLPTGTVQGLTESLTWTFAVTQDVAGTTSS